MSDTPRENPAVRVQVEDVPPPGRLLVPGLQHVLVMYTGCVAVPLIARPRSSRASRWRCVDDSLADAHSSSAARSGLDTRTIGLLVNADLVVAGIVALVQTLGVGRILGVRLPVVTGVTFAAVTPMILIGQNFGLPGVYGSMIVSGIFGLLVAITRRCRPR